MENEKWWKNTEIFSGGLILMGGLPSNFNLGHFKVAFHLMDHDINLQNLLPIVSKFR
jgi:hypothetical protein